MSLLLLHYALLQGNISFDKYYYMDNIIASQSSLSGEKANVYVQDVSKSGCVNSGEGPGCPLSFVSYVAVKGGDIYHLGFYEDAVLSDIEKQILSTFKFTDVKTEVPSEINRIFSAINMITVMSGCTLYVPWRAVKPGNPCHPFPAVNGRSRHLRRLWIALQD